MSEEFIVKPGGFLKSEDIAQMEELIDSYEYNLALDMLTRLREFTYGSMFDQMLEDIGDSLLRHDYSGSEKTCEQIIKLLQQLELNVGKPIVLAIDDQSDVISMIKSILRLNYYTYGVTTPENALKFLDSHVPNIILLDIEMPRMDGYTLLSIIRKMDSLKEVPVCFLTSSATAHHIAKAAELGAKGYIKKPVNAAILLDKLQDLLK